MQVECESPLPYLPGLLITQSKDIPRHITTTGPASPSGDVIPDAPHNSSVVIVRLVLTRKYLERIVVYLASALLLLLSMHAAHSCSNCVFGCSGLAPATSIEWVKRRQHGQPQPQPQPRPSPSETHTLLISFASRACSAGWLRAVILQQSHADFFLAEPVTGKSKVMHACMHACTLLVAAAVN